MMVSAEMLAEATNELRAVRAERDALAERAEALHKALRELAIDTAGFDTFTGTDAMQCLLCACKWWKGGLEDHESSCLAAPSAPKEAA